jgi:hypothetical protein
VHRRCGSCNRPLKDPGSIELGYGPGCWSRLSTTARAIALTGGGGVAESSHAPPLVPVQTATSVAPDATPSENAAPAASPAGATTATRSQPPPRSTSPLAVVASWTIVLLAVYVLLEHWRWVLAGVALVAATASVGLLVEHVQRRRAEGHGPPER